MQESTSSELEVEAEELRQHLESSTEQIARLEDEIQGLQSTDEARAAEMEALGPALHHIHWSHKHQN